MKGREDEREGGWKGGWKGDVRRAMSFTQCVSQA